MKFDVNKLKQIARPLTDEERREMAWREENREWLAISEKIALRLRCILRTEGISQLELAARLCVTPAQVSKILSGRENLGIKTISRLEKAVGQSLIDVPEEAAVAKQPERSSSAVAAVKHKSPARSFSSFAGQQTLC